MRALTSLRALGATALLVLGGGLGIAVVNGSRVLNYPAAVALYHDLRRSLSGTVYMPEEQDAPVSCWGDSLTFGGLDTFRHNWPDILNDVYHRPTLNRGVRSDTSSDTARRVLSRNKGRGPETVVIWAGRNNWYDPEKVKQDIARMISSLNDGSHYLVLGILHANISDEWKGTKGYDSIQALNRDLASAYGSRFVPIEDVLLRHANKRFPGDLADVEHGIVPGSLRGDELHLNDHGQAIVAGAVEDAMAAQAW